MQLTGQRQCNWAVKCDAFTQTAIPQAVNAEIGHRLKPYAMGSEDVPEDLRKPASERTLKADSTFCRNCRMEGALGSSSASNIYRRSRGSLATLA